MFNKSHFIAIASLLLVSCVKLLTPPPATNGAQSTPNATSGAQSTAPIAQGTEACGAVTACIENCNPDGVVTQESRAEVMSCAKACTSKGSTKALKLMKDLN